MRTVDGHLQMAMFDQFGFHLRMGLVPFGRRLWPAGVHDVDDERLIVFDQLGVHLERLNLRSDLEFEEGLGFLVTCHADVLALIVGIDLKQFQPIDRVGVVEFDLVFHEVQFFLVVQPFHLDAGSIQFALEQADVRQFGQDLIFGFAYEEDRRFFDGQSRDGRDVIRLASHEAYVFVSYVVDGQFQCLRGFVELGDVLLRFVLFDQLAVEEPFEVDVAFRLDVTQFRHRALKHCCFAFLRADVGDAFSETNLFFVDDDLALTLHVIDTARVVAFVVDRDVLHHQSQFVLLPIDLVLRSRLNRLIVEEPRDWFIGTVNDALERQRLIFENRSVLQSLQKFRFQIADDQISTGADLV